ncbi:capsid protein [Capybara virus 29_cap3_1096]|nr:capsid protein [Capybara virus 29_cap3_1096]
MPIKKRAKHYTRRYRRYKRWSGWKRSWQNRDNSSVIVKAGWVGGSQITVPAQETSGILPVVNGEISTQNQLLLGYQYTSLFTRYRQMYDEMRVLGLTAEYRITDWSANASFNAGRIRPRFIFMVDRNFDASDYRGGADFYPSNAAIQQSPSNKSFALSPYSVKGCKMSVWAKNRSEKNYWHTTKTAQTANEVFGTNTQINTQWTDDIANLHYDWNPAIFGRVIIPTQAQAVTFTIEIVMKFWIAYRNPRLDNPVVEMREDFFEPDTKKSRLEGSIITDVEPEREMLKDDDDE